MNAVTNVLDLIYISGEKSVGIASAARISIYALPTILFPVGLSLRSLARFGQSQLVSSLLNNLSLTITIITCIHLFIVIKIKALASQMVLVEWIPPNIGADLARDYMEKMGANNVPVTGSRAATKRKQQLEFQVPPHDVDANLCDNLSESESQQMQQYVEKIREHCVGQGCVVRVGTYGQGVLATLPEEKSNQISSKLSKSIEVLKCLQTDLPDSVSIEHDPILSEILGNSKIAKAVLEPVPYNYPKIFMAFMEPFADFNNENNKVSPTTGNCFEPQIRKLIRPQMVQNLHGLNEAAIRSAVLHGAIYDRVFEILKVCYNYIIIYLHIVEYDFYYIFDYC